jgi:DNA-binding transcriptional MerR regulator
MNNKEMMRLAKEALKQPWLYTEEELQYMRQARKKAKRGVKINEMRKLNAERKTDSSNTES